MTNLRKNSYTGQRKESDLMDIE